MRPMNDAERAEMYRRKLVGTNAVLNRSRQRERDLEAVARSLFECIDEHCKAHQAPVPYTVGVCRDRLAKAGIEVGA